jgi:hypothetical protein
LKVCDVQLGESIKSLLQDISHIDKAISIIKMANHKQALTNKVNLELLRKYEEDKNISRASV